MNFDENRYIHPNTSNERDHVNLSEMIKNDRKSRDFPKMLELKGFDHTPIRCLSLKTKHFPERLYFEESLFQNLEILTF